MNNRVRCSNCNLINFANASVCKRCENPLQNINYSSEGTTLNINISLPPGAFQQPARSAAAPPPQARRPPLPPHQNQADPRYFEAQPQQPISFQTPESQQPPISFQTPDYPPQSNIGFNQWSQINPPVYPPPYAHPYQQSYGQPYLQQEMHSQGIWQKGGELVVHRNATFPATCVKCGNQYSSSYDTVYVRQKFRWHNPLLYIALISPLIYCILSLVLSQTVSLEIPLCRKHVDDRNATKNFLIGGGVLAAILIVFSFSAEIIGFGFLVFFAALIGLALGHEYLYKPFRVSKIEGDYVHLKGVNDGYRNQFPYC